MTSRHEIVAPAITKFQRTLFSQSQRATPSPERLIKDVLGLRALPRPRDMMPSIHRPSVFRLGTRVTHVHEETADAQYAREQAKLAAKAAAQQAAQDRMIQSFYPDRFEQRKEWCVIFRTVTGPGGPEGGLGLSVCWLGRRARRMRAGGGEIAPSAYDRSKRRSMAASKDAHVDPKGERPEDLPFPSRQGCETHRCFPTATLRPAWVTCSVQANMGGASRPTMHTHTQRIHVWIRVWVHMLTRAHSKLGGPM